MPQWTLFRPYGTGSTRLFYFVKNKGTTKLKLQPALNKLTVLNTISRIENVHHVVKKKPGNKPL